MRKVVELDGWKINLQVCYDLRFPVWSKNRLNDDEYEYDILLYIANWPEIRSNAYKILLGARAIENQAYVIWVNRVGYDNNQVYHTGDSRVICPSGEILAAAKAGKEEILPAILSRAALDEFRERYRFSLDWDKFTVHT